MDYIELSCSYNHKNEETSEILIARLADLGYESFVEEHGLLKAYIQQPLFLESSLDEVQCEGELSCHVSFSWKTIEPENWNQQWESNFQPVEVGTRCIVRAPFHQVEKSFEYDIIIEPKMSFGTGHHETTQLMLEAILEQDCRGKQVVDCGCGTGVLAILASKRGAAFVKGFDVEPWACENTSENFERNGVSNFKVECKGVESIQGESYDIILANINRNILLGSMQAFARSLSRGGVLILSGFYTNDVEIIRSAAQSEGLLFVSSSDKNNWVSCTFHHQ